MFDMELENSRVTCLGTHNRSHRFKFDFKWLNFECLQRPSFLHVVSAVTVLIEFRISDNLTACEGICLMELNCRCVK